MMDLVKLRNEIDEKYSRIKRQGKVFDSFTHIADYVDLVQANSLLHESISHSNYRDIQKAYRELSEVHLAINQLKDSDMGYTGKVLPEIVLDMKHIRDKIFFEIESPFSRGENIILRSPFGTSRGDVFWEKMPNYRAWLEKVHTYLLSELHRMTISSQQVSNPFKDKIYFDLKKSILHFLGTEIPISLKTDKTDSHYLFLELLKAPEEKLYYSEMRKEVFGDTYKWNKAYNAATGIQTKIAKKTTRDDFLIIKSGESGFVQIDPKYLDKLRLQ